MNKIPLSEYVKTNGQNKTARELGITQGAISKAILSGRQIFISNDGSKVKAEEIKPFPVIST